MEKNYSDQSTPFNITSLFFEQASISPQKQAIISSKGSKSFQELEEAVIAYAGYLKRKGIGKGDRIFVFAPMSLDMYTALLAILRIGGVVVFLDEWSGFERLNTCCREAQCKGFLSGLKGSLVGLLSSEVRKIPVKLRLGGKGRSKMEALPDVFTHKDDAALITFTTGSSGIPKAADRSHGFLWEQFKVLRKEIDAINCPINMPVLPIVLLINLGCGVTSVIADFKASKPDALKSQKVIDQLKQHRVNSITASPFFINRLAEYILDKELSGEMGLLKQIFTGGGAVMPREAKKFRMAFPDTSIEVLYGSTEAEPISKISVDDLAHRNLVEDRGLLVGNLDPQIALKIIQVSESPINNISQAALEDLELPEGEMGEIVVAGPHVLSRYFNNPKAFNRNKIVIDDICWHRTGDSGFLKDGHLYLTGPCSKLIFSNGDFLSPFVYEDTFAGMEGVSAATILLHQGKVTAVIEASSISESLKSLILADQAINDVVCLASLPRDPRHRTKIDYEALHRLIDQ